MKKLILLFLTLSSLGMLNAMEEREKSIYSPKKGTFDILPVEIAEPIMCRVLEGIFKTMNTLESTHKVTADDYYSINILVEENRKTGRYNEEFKTIFEEFLRNLFSTHKDENGERVYILGLSNFKKYNKQFTCQVFKLCRGNFVLPTCFLEKIRKVYSDSEEILNKNSLLVLITTKRITNYKRLNGKKINDLDGLKLLRQLPQFSETTLDLLHNEITNLPFEFGNLTNLTDLNLSKNKLNILNPQLGRLIKLKTLNLSYNQLTILPQELGQLTNLHLLYLSNNSLTELSSELRNLSNLIRLDLNHNQLTVLPKELGQLINLQQLHLLFNNLTNLPSELGNLSKLEIVNLGNNTLNDTLLNIEIFVNIPYVKIGLIVNQFNKEKKKELREKFGTKIRFLYVETPTKI